MLELNKNELKQRELNILLQIKYFCENNNIKYYLAGGTLLGAIRHKGFIPWDDDIDICMPRKDYEKFVYGFQNNKKELEVYSSLLGNMSIPFCKVYDKKTIIKSEFNHNKQQLGLWIDIFPVDGLPEDIELVTKIYNIVAFYRKILILTKAKPGKGKSILKKYLKYILIPTAKFYGANKLVNKITGIAKKYSYEESRFVGNIVWGLYGIGERMPKDEFERSVMVEFEGYEFPTFSCWDNYLRGLYGDYMKIPAIEERNNHNMKVYYL